MSYSSTIMSIPTPLEEIHSTYSSSPASVLVAGTGGLSASAFPVATVSTWDRQNTLMKLIDNGYWVKATGSRVTTNFTEESDYDYVVFDPEYKLMLEGWALGGSGDNGHLNGRIFSSLKKGPINLILVDKEDQWKKWIIATNLIKAINPTSKEERINLFNTVFGNTPNSKAMDF